MTFYRNSINYFASFGLRHFPKYLTPLKEEIIKSNLSILFEVYVGRMIFFSVVSFFATFAASAAILLLLSTPVLISMLTAAAAAGVMSLTVIAMSHSYPFHVLSSKRKSIEANMPFSINHMSAIASSGVPPLVIFRLLSNIGEYGEIANEAKRIVRNVDAFGMDLTSAIRNVADRTPSAGFRQFLYGIVSTTETGGNLQDYLESSGRDALFNYKLSREKYLQTLGIYADFYTAVLIAAPLFFVSVLSILALIGGQIFGMDITTAIKLGVYLILPLLNTAFILFIHYTQPRI